MTRRYPSEATTLPEIQPVTRTDVACGVAQRAIDDLQTLIDADPDDPDTVEIHDMMIALLKGKATLRERARRRAR